MKTLLLMRHAKSAWDDAGVADHARPLNARGRKSAPQMAALLMAEQAVPELILCSTALRARETALAVAEAAEWRLELRVCRGLYLAEPAAILREVARAPADVACLMVVGHNPGMEDLVSDLSLTRQAMPTAAIARFAIASDDWVDVTRARAELVQVWRPREIE